MQSSKTLLRVKCKYTYLYSNFLRIDSVKKVIIEEDSMKQFSELSFKLRFQIIVNLLVVMEPDI